MKFKLKAIALVSVMFLMSAGVTDAAEVAVIVHPSSGIAKASAEQVADLFLGKTKDLGGAKAVAVDQKEGAAPRDQFYQVVVGKDSSQLRAYWSKLVFTGKGKPPKEVGSDADVVAAVAADPTLVGYVSPQAVTDKVVVVLKIP